MFTEKFHTVRRFVLKESVKILTEKLLKILCMIRVYDTVWMGKNGLPYNENTKSLGDE